MLRLRIILLSKVPYYSILICVLIITMIRLWIPNKSCYQGTETVLSGRLIENKVDGEQLHIVIAAKEKVIGYVYFETEREQKSWIKNYHLGDTIKVTGTLKKITSETVPNLYSYQKIQNRKRIFYRMQIHHYEKLQENKNLIYWFYNKIEKRLNKLPFTSSYVRTFLLGDKSMLSDEVKESYQVNGISHLLAISGMHISFLSGVILFLLRKLGISEKKRYGITMLFLLLYLILTGATASVLRATLFFFLFSINKIYYFYIEPLCLFWLTLSLTLLYQPYFIYEVGFQFSFLISFFLLKFSSFINRRKLRLFQLLKVSILSFLGSVPITIYNFYQINLGSILYNLFYVPFVTFLIFPMSLITFCFPFLDKIYYGFLFILEKSSLFLSTLPYGKWIFAKPSICFTILMILLTVIILELTTRKKYRYTLLYLCFFVSYYFYPNYQKKDFMTMLDVGQGDSLLLFSQNKTVLVDTGGVMPFAKESWQRQSTSFIVKQKIIPYLKSLGMKRIDYLILSHGDYDHMGESTYLVENFKVNRVILNCGPYNDLEKDLIRVLNKKNIKYYSCIEKLNIGKYELQFLNTGEYDNENDNSNVIYLNYNDYQLLFMGDAGLAKEKDILEKYDFTDIDILKIGHHGSNTSSSKEFINRMNPKYSLISVGNNNRYGHPNDEVLKKLSESKIYRTDIDGSVVFTIKKDQLKIETYEP